MARQYVRSEYGTVFTYTGTRPSFLSNAQRISREEFLKDRADQIKEYVKSGDTLYTMVVHVSRSGMSRRIKVYAIRDNEPINLSRWVADLLEWRYHEKSNAVTVSGCGMDMCFHTVYSLAYALFGDGYALTKRDM